MGIGMVNPTNGAAIQNNQNTEVSNTKQKKKQKSKGSGTGVALAAGVGISSAYSPVTQLTASGLAKFQKKLTPEQIELLNNAGEKIIDVTNMRSKGVAIQDVNTFNTLFSVDPTLKSIAIGKNACFVPKSNQVLFNKSKGAALQFHELGHAYNYNISKVWKVIQKFRIPAMIASLGLVLFAACTKDAVAKEGEELTQAQKTKNFVRHNAGKLAFGTMLPVLAEEGMASIRGCKWAKQMLSPEMFKHVTKTNVLAYTSYLGAAAAMGLAAWGAVKIKDHFAAKKAQETQQANQNQQTEIKQENIEEKETQQAA